MGKTVILYIVDIFIKMAGAERNLFEVVTRLNLQKYRPIVLCLYGGELVGLLRSKNIETIDLKLLRIFSFNGLIKALKIFKLIKDRKVKIVVTYHESSDFLGGIVSKFAGVPVIISSRRDMGYRLKKRHILFYRLINNLFDKIITVSDAVKEEIFNKQGVLWHKLTTIHNGVELERFSKETDKEDLKTVLGLEKNKPVVGILAALRPIKGHRFFLEAASLVLKELPETYFLIVGWYDSEDYYKELRSFTSKLGIEKNVIFVDGRTDTAGMLSVMDIAVLSSINEGFPNAVLEYMAASKPVVGTNSGGTAEAVVNGETGILVPTCDAKALSDALKELLKNRNLAEHMGKNGRKRAEDYFGINRMMENIQELYEQLLVEKENKIKYRIPISMKSLLKKTLKNLLSDTLYYSGLIIICKKTISSNRGIIILAYHRINNDSFDPLGMNISVEHFERQMRYLKKNYNIISLEEAIQLLRENKKIPEENVVITFDDGYKDNYINAFPILKKYVIPATIFLSAEAVDKKQMLWFDKITSAFKKTTKSRLNLQELNLKDYNIGSIHIKMTVAKEAVFFAKKLSPFKRGKFIRYLLHELDDESAEKESDEIMLCWDEIIEMQGNGVSFGSHGVTHSILTQFSNEELEYEINESRRIIEEKAGIGIKLFAYPNGGSQDFNRNIEQLLLKKGYAGACTLIKGSNNGISNLYALKRFGVNRMASSGLFSSFSASLFDAEISGIPRCLLRLFLISVDAGNSSINKDDIN